MDKEDRKLQKYLVGEMMKVSKTNPDVMLYMQALMKTYEDLQQRIEKAVEYINNTYMFDYENEDRIELKDQWYAKELLNILKGDDTK